MPPDTIFVTLTARSRGSCHCDRTCDVSRLREFTLCVVARGNATPLSAISSRPVSACRGASFRSFSLSLASPRYVNDPCSRDALASTARRQVRRVAYFCVARYLVAMRAQPAIALGPEPYHCILRDRLTAHFYSSFYDRDRGDIPGQSSTGQEDRKAAEEIRMRCEHVDQSAREICR